MFFSFVTEFEATLTTMTDFIPLGMFGFHRQVITGVVDAGINHGQTMVNNNYTSSL